MCGVDTNLKRNFEIKVRLSTEELHHLSKCVKKTTFSREGYVRRLINDYEPKSAPPDEYYEIIRELRKMNTELKRYTDAIPKSGIESIAFFTSVTKRLTNACDRLQNLFLPRHKAQ